jgi:hypothetical protein
MDAATERKIIAGVAAARGEEVGRTGVQDAADALLADAQLLAGMVVGAARVRAARCVRLMEASAQLEEKLFSPEAIANVTKTETLIKLYKAAQKAASNDLRFIMETLKLGPELERARRELEARHDRGLRATLPMPERTHPARPAELRRSRAA